MKGWPPEHVYREELLLFNEYKYEYEYNQKLTITTTILIIY